MFFLLKNEGRNSAGKKCCFCLLLRHLSRAIPLRRKAGPPVLANTARQFTNVEIKHTHRKKKQFTPFFSGRNRGNKVFGKGFHHTFSFSPLEAEFWVADPGAASHIPPTPQPSSPSQPHLHLAKALGLVLFWAACAQNYWLCYGKGACT